MLGTGRRDPIKRIGEVLNRGCRVARHHHQPQVKPDRPWQAYMLPNERMAGLHDPSLLTEAWTPLRHVPPIDGRCAPGLARSGNIG